MTDDLTRALARLSGYLEPRLRADPELRAVVAGLARAVADWAADLGPALADPIAPAAAAPPPPAAPVALPPPPPVVPISQLPPLRIGYTPPPAFPTPPPDTTTDRELDLVPLPLVADRCRVKGEACRLVARRFGELDGARDAAAEADVQRRAARLPDCKLWMLDRDPVVALPRAWDDLAGAFAVAADAALLLHAWEESAGPLADRHAGRVLGLAAEAQSTLLYAVADVRDVKVDFDQVQLFAHVRSVARDRQVFVPKYLKREDRARPEAWPDVSRRVGEQATQFRAVGDRDKARQKALKNLKFKVGKLRDGGDAAGEWPRVFELVDELVAGGLPASNAELRDLLLPVLEDIPDDPPPPPAVGQVLHEIDRYLESRPDAEPEARAARPSAEVAEVAGLLAGRELVLIGGQARQQHKAALCRAFGLTDIRWVCTPDHTSFTVFEPDIARPEVAVVLLAIRWSNHDYDGVKAYCEEYDKPLIRLPGGYNANQVAHHILAQAGERLRASRAAAG
ncbi:MAG: hypothetical protein K2X82_09240 [Gemmataceae bacterium]|nr:hypothetical protein [Gemmataceae bacterium]